MFYVSAWPTRGTFENPIMGWIRFMVTFWLRRILFSPWKVVKFFDAFSVSKLVIRDIRYSCYSRILWHQWRSFYTRITLPFILEVDHRFGILWNALSVRHVFISCKRKFVFNLRMTMWLWTLHESFNPRWQIMKQIIWICMLWRLKREKMEFFSEYPSPEKVINF